MTVYAIAQLTVTDRPSYDRYQARFLDVLRRHDGRLLAADEAPRVVEGQWDHDKVVVLSFADAAAFTAFAESDDYRQISVDRKAGSHGPVLLVSGWSG